MHINIKTDAHLSMNIVFAVRIRPNVRIRIAINSSANIVDSSTNIVISISMCISTSTIM